MESKKTSKPLCGFIGQGWIGKHYADDFEARGFSAVRYAKEPAFEKNKERIKECDIVFIAVPTPTTPTGFDDSIVREVIKLVGKGKIAIIKSTILPGTTVSIQKENPEIFVFHSPEFLREASAAHDAAHPDRNIIGIPKDTEEFQKKAEEVLSVLPDAPFKLVCDSNTAELIKYAGNCFLFTKVVFMNMLYDLSQKLGCDFEKVKDAMMGDPRIGTSHMDPMHGGARGAGGHCFIKDFAAFSEMYEKNVGDKIGVSALHSLEQKNIDLLKASGKDADLLRGVYGDSQEVSNKDFDAWNEKKKSIDAETLRFYTVREIWWCSLGVNVGTEQNGKGDEFARPCVIVQAFGMNGCMVIPLTTSKKENKHRISIGEVSGKAAKANLSQVRVIDTRRLIKKIGFLDKALFHEIEKHIRDLF
jgi:mRNA-degrading endonuclease toxin of MazEF toxin-antitoxin module